MSDPSAEHRLSAPSTRAELSEITSLALPMMAAQGGLMLMGVVDTLLIGRVSSMEMSAVALGNSIATLISVFGIGLAMGIEPLVAQAHGAGEHARARSWLWQGTYAAMLVAVPLMIVAGLATRLVEPLGISRELASEAAAYLWTRVPGILANCLFAVLRAYLSATGQPRPILISVLIANVANALLDWGLIFGAWGLPALGARGAGLATSIGWTLMTLILALAVSRLPPPTGAREDGRPVRAYRPLEVMTVARLGSPIGLHLVAEVGIFAFSSAMIARFGEVQLAGHQVALSLAGLSFMCAVGIANASTARVGLWVGAGDTPKARRAGLVGIALGGAFMGMCGAAFVMCRSPLAALFAPTDPAAQTVGRELLLLAAAFSVVDGVQAVSAGALRGAGDTQWPFYANVIGHFGVALPVALALGQHEGMGATGYWWGLTAGLFVVAMILAGRFLALSSRPIARV